MHSVAFPPPPPTSNTLASHERSALVRSSRKLYKILGQVPRMSDDELPLTSRPPTPSPLELTRTSLLPASDTESTWRKRKPTHLAPLLKFSSGTVDAPDPLTFVKSPVYHRLPMDDEWEPLTASGSSTLDTLSDFSQRRTKLERLRRKLGDEVPATSVFPTPPLTAVPAVSRTPRASSSSKRLPHARTHSVAAHQPDDARSIAFSVSSDESMHTVTFTTRVQSSGPKTKHVYHTGALPPVPLIPMQSLEDDDAGLVRPRPKMGAGSKIGGSDFKAARRAKREARGKNGKAEPGELVEMVGFMR